MDALLLHLQNNTARVFFRWLAHFKNILAGRASVLYVLRTPLKLPRGSGELSAVTEKLAPPSFSVAAPSFFVTTPSRDPGLTRPYFQIGIQRLHNVAAIRLPAQLAFIKLRLHRMEQIAALQMQLLAETESRPLVDRAAKELLSPHAAELAFNILLCLFSICR